MKEYKNITRDDLPCSYELSWQEKPPAIILRVHKDFIANAPDIPNNAPIIKNFMESKFGFERFCTNFKGNFGFDDAFQLGGETDEFVEFVAAIPRVEKETGKPCPSCNGSGKDGLFGNEKCRHCNGEGKEWRLYWKPAYAISASFTLFTVLARFPEKETSSSLLQLLTVHTVTEKEINGGAFNGEFSRPLTSWMRELAKQENSPEAVKKVIQTMKNAHRAMFRLKDFHKFSFRANIGDGGRFHADCPGNATGIDPLDSPFNESEGYKFCTHNADSPMQQITLLAGLTALHDEARKNNIGIPNK